MATRISATKLDHELSEILNRVLYREESFVIERSGRAIARLEPLGPRRGVTLQEVIDQVGNLRVPEGFAEQIEALRADQEMLGEPRWGS